MLVVFVRNAAQWKKSLADLYTCNRRN